MSKSWISLDLDVQFNGVDMLSVSRVFEMSVFEEFGTCIRAGGGYVQVFTTVND